MRSNSWDVFENGFYIFAPKSALLEELKCLSKRCFWMGLNRFWALKLPAFMKMTSRSISTETIRPDSEKKSKKVPGLIQSLIRSSTGLLREHPRVDLWGSYWQWKIPSLRLLPRKNIILGQYVKFFRSIYNQVHHLWLRMLSKPSSWFLVWSPFQCLRCP